uniref:helix-turn-helix domain-containing protein n=1 Tax=Burkholderia gladioli TaxID=28095 RepID=UPI003709B144
MRGCRPGRSGAERDGCAGNGFLCSGLRRLGAPLLSEALAASGGRVAEAAARIGIGRATLYKKIAALGLDA